MAKGIRSKSMRKNRSYLRQTVVEPIIQKRQEKLNEKLQAAVKAKDSSTLLGLKSLISTTQGSTDKKSENVEDEKEEDEDAMEEDNDETSKAVAAMTQKKGKKDHPFKKQKAVKASKPKHQKEMVWFK